MNTLWMYLQFSFVQKGLLAIAVLALAAGVLGPLIVARKLSFAVHGSSELALTGAAAALLFDRSLTAGALIGCVIAAFAFALLSFGGPDKDAIVGVVMSFGLGLAVLFLHLYHGRQAQALALLTGQIISVSTSGLTTLIIICTVVTFITLLLYPQFLFLTLEPELAESRGLKTKTWSVLCMLLISLVTAEAVQIIGSLLVVSLMITPAAAARYLAHTVRGTIGWSIVIALISGVGGMLISLGPGWPVSAPITFVAFVSYILARIYARIR